MLIKPDILTCSQHGAAPGLMAGVFQTNVRLPEKFYGQEVSMVPLYPFSGNEVGGPAYVYVK